MFSQTEVENGKITLSMQSIKTNIHFHSLNDTAVHSRFLFCFYFLLIFEKSIFNSCFHFRTEFTASLTFSCYGSLHLMDLSQFYIYKATGNISVKFRQYNLRRFIRTPVYKDNEHFSVNLLTCSYVYVSHEAK